jgi:hypothetical protein
MTYTIAVYDCRMCYGGPEEGGWWYDAGTLVRIIKTIRNENRAYAFCRRLNGKLRSRVIGPNVDKHDYSSVLSEGELLASIWVGEVPHSFPARRPHYE